ncbi:hypothetical protein T492DRAFT_1126069 [Pavlovales sp. CCMP2436]|nr:hypothetical protein T492DRAFT_1126069 [Pavlovales sp. CCMP2436]
MSFLLPFECLFSAGATATLHAGGCDPLSWKIFPTSTGSNDAGFAGRAGILTASAFMAQLREFNYTGCATHTRTHPVRAELPAAANGDSAASHLHRSGQQKAQPPPLSIDLDNKKRPPLSIDLDNKKRPPLSIDLDNKKRSKKELEQKIRRGIGFEKEWSESDYHLSDSDPESEYEPEYESGGAPGSLFERGSASDPRHGFESASTHIVSSHARVREKSSGMFRKKPDDSGIESDEFGRGLDSSESKHPSGERSRASATGFSDSALGSAWVPGSASSHRCAREKSSGMFRKKPDESEESGESGRGLEKSKPAPSTPSPSPLPSSVLPPPPPPPALWSSVDSNGGQIHIAIRARNSSWSRPTGSTTAWPPLWPSENAHYWSPSEKVDGIRMLAADTKVLQKQVGPLYGADRIRMLAADTKVLPKQVGPLYGDQYPAKPSGPSLRSVLYGDLDSLGQGYVVFDVPASPGVPRSLWVYATAPVYHILQPALLAHLSLGTLVPKLLRFRVRFHNPTCDVLN